ncbi:MAG: hypothetical protein ACQEST_05310 [Bacteroidota bacterium]
MKNLNEYMMGFLLVLLSMCIGFGVIACEGPSGSEGPQGLEGAEGPVGPAGEDGSMMYSGEGEPDGSIGDIDDYYLNQDTGELYGPKDEDGWGDPGVVLMGDDGEDGTHIHSGSGSPDASLGVVGDFYIDVANQNLYGPKTDSGWGSPIDLNGADGVDGKDGSQFYSGTGSPDASLGATGDYYFDTANKDLYGPKTDSGWETPINLSGDDGQDGADGQAGSQIYSGSGAPDASLGTVGDYYLDKTNYDLYGPKTKPNKVSDGWGNPLNLKGADGSDNVTRYIYPNSIDFTSTYNKSFSLNAIGINSDEDLVNHIFLVYLKYEDFSLEGTIYYQLPGYGYNEDTFYATYHYWSESLGQANLSIIKQDGPGEVYNELEIVRIEAGDYDYPSYKVAEQHIIPDHLDTSNYQAVAEFYGFYK